MVVLVIDMCFGKRMYKAIFLRIISFNYLVINLDFYIMLNQLSLKPNFFLSNIETKLKEYKKNYHQI